jgi:hypothetical protein
MIICIVLTGEITTGRFAEDMEVDAEYCNSFFDLNKSAGARGINLEFLVLEGFPEAFDLVGL